MNPKARTTALFLFLLISRGLLAQTQANDLNLMTMNTYCFPPWKVTLLKKLGIVDLVSGVDTPIPERIRRIAAFARQKNPDVVFFQELWGKDNKEEMIRNLQPTFKYVFWNDQIKPKYVSYLDDGLLIASRRIPFMERHIEYRDREGDEDAGLTRGGAHKGALIIGVYDGKGKAILMVDTHLQSGTNPEAVLVRTRQIAQVCRELKKIQDEDPRTRDAQIIFAGDVNDPVSWRGDNKRLVNRTRQMTEVFRKEGFPINNDWLIDYLVKKYKPDDVAEIFELERRAVFKTATGAEGYEIAANGGKAYAVSRLSAPKASLGVGTAAPEPDDAVAGRLNGNDSRWTFFPDATDPIGNQILDHVYVLNSRSEVKNFRVFREECLGDAPGLGTYHKDPKDLKPGEVFPWEGRTIHFNGKKAISDHAAIMVTISGK